MLSLYDVGRCCIASSLAYASDEETIFKGLKAIGFDLVTRIKSPDLGLRDFVAKGRLGGALVTLVAMRGTAFDGQDILDDIEGFPVRPKGWYGSDVDRGFWDRSNGIFDQIAETTEDAQFVVLTGHSLGAAAAQLTAARLNLRPRQNVRYLVTFGSPRVAIGGLGVMLNGIEHWRCVHAADIVTSVPPLLMGFRHDKGERAPVYLTRSGEIWLKSTMLARCIDRMLQIALQPIEIIEQPWELSRWQLVGLDDHKVARYGSFFPKDAPAGPIPRSPV